MSNELKVSYPKLHRVIGKAGWTSDDAPAPGGKVRHLPVITTQDVHPDKVLLNALGELEDLMLVGWRHNGQG